MTSTFFRSGSLGFKSGVTVKPQAAERETYWKSGSITSQVLSLSSFVFVHVYYKAAMALAATLRPSGSVRSVMDKTTLGLASACNFTSSETCEKHTHIHKDLTLSQ